MDKKKITKKEIKYILKQLGYRKNKDIIMLYEKHELYFPNQTELENKPGNLICFSVDNKSLELYQNENGKSVNLDSDMNVIVYEFDNKHFYKLSNVLEDNKKTEPYFILGDYYLVYDRLEENKKIIELNGTNGN